MSRFRATDEQLDGEIGTLAAIVRIRRRRSEEELDRLEQELAELRRERRRRQGVAVAAVAGTEADVSA